MYDVQALAAECRAAPEEIQEALANLVRRGVLSTEQDGSAALEASAPARCRSNLERSLCSRLLGYELTENPYIVRSPDIHGGIPIIAGSRVPVSAVVGYFRCGRGTTEILQFFPQLSLTEVEAAIEYYFRHRDSQELTADVPPSAA